MNEFLQFLQEHLIECVSLCFAVISAILNLLLVRINAKIRKEISGIDIDGDGIGDVDQKFGEFYLQCKHCHRYSKLSEATFIKEVKDEEKA